MVIRKRGGLVGLFIAAIAVLTVVSVSLMSNDNAKAEERFEFKNVAIGEATDVAGYDIAEPAYIPSGFARGSTVTVAQLGQGRFGSFPKHVQQVWTWKEDHSVRFALVQSPKYFEVLGGEPTEISGTRGLSSFADGTLGLTWEMDDMCFGLAARLTGPLDEETLYKIAESVRLGNDQNTD